jgi:hypothetical protein
MSIGLFKSLLVVVHPPSGPMPARPGIKFVPCQIDYATPELILHKPAVYFPRYFILRSSCSLLVITNRLKNLPVRDQHRKPEVSSRREETGEGPFYTTGTGKNAEASQRGTWCGSNEIATPHRQPPRAPRL